MDDTIYTTSTQHRLFTFTAKQLSDLRHATNKAAIEKTTTTILTREESTTTASSTPPQNPEPIDCPTAKEELKLVSYYSVKCMQLSDHFQFPSNVKATALTFFHRLYLTTSTLTLHPKKLLLPILYLATKTENHYIPITTFITTAATAGPKVTKQDLLDPEFTISMGLRWSFQVWHPFRGLEGIFLEINAIQTGTYQPPPTKQDMAPSPSSAKASLSKLTNGDTERIWKAHGEARKLLTTTTLLTDVYFLYTPPQIAFAALWEADPEIARFYIDVKFPVDTPVKEKLVAVVTALAKDYFSQMPDGDGPRVESLLLLVPGSGVATCLADAVDQELVREVTRIDKKLYRVTRRLKGGDGVVRKVKAESGGSEGNGNGDDGDEEERRIKKRRLERERAEREGDVFGAPLESGSKVVESRGL